ncbi:glycosyltransferase family 4 protein [Streptomyces botrytidirepellens]|uniref:D-inositol 3-phosphate glycosyltransferase n=1 Tax=Streptomyces botrytidirepellens TaxID=2486417 RepID=A0A3M8SJ08_9ACTN|nr:glycosyltransferase family 4 protein [Streptomyces botrytidirepellens]RNF79174.1 glycosyltransferase family 4 protein [Streptomyces botrytidirepellens]
MKIAFLLHNAYGIGGTIRSTFNLAGALAARHRVEIVSLIRTIDTPGLPLPRGVRVRPLIDQRPDVPRESGDLGNPLLKQPSAHVPAAESKGTVNFNALTDQRLAAYLADTDADVVIATRPGLVICLAALGQQGRYLRIGQEHRLYETHRAEIRTACDAALARLDANTSVSEADARTHRDRLPGISTLLTGLPNCVPATGVQPSDGNAKLVVAAGRLIPVKRYDLLVSAWATVAAKHPDWHLRIYGRGPQAPALRRQIDELGLAGHITMMGAHSPIETEWAKGAIAAVTSREESFGMTIVEAMHCGVPVVATDCPHGPGEIITDGHDGMLVPVGDADGIAKGLLTLIEDDALRRSMGEAARVAAQRYAPARLATAYEELFAELFARRGQSPRTGPRPAAAARAFGSLAGHPAVPRKTFKSVVKQLIRKPLRPVASCRVDADGTMAVLVEPADVHGTGLALTLTHRGGRGAQVRVPLRPPAAPGAPWTATLDRRAIDLAEGRWDVHVVRSSDGVRRRVMCRFAEGRGLVGLDPLPGSPFTWWIPYPTVDGYLALRAWRRPAHAEARVIRAEADGLVVEGTLHGARFAADAAASVLATPRGAALPFTAGVTALDATRFRFTVPYERIHAARGDQKGTAGWDLTLRKTPDSTTAIRIGRVIGDILDRHKTDLHPVTHGVRPYLGKSGDLAITCAPQED